MKSALSGPLPPTRASGEAVVRGVDQRPATASRPASVSSPSCGTADDERPTVAAPVRAARARRRRARPRPRAWRGRHRGGVGLRDERLDRRDRALADARVVERGRAPSLAEPALAIVSGSALPRWRFVGRRQQRAQDRHRGEAPRCRGGARRPPTSAARRRRCGRGGGSGGGRAAARSWRGSPAAA